MSKPCFSEYFESKYSSEPERRRYAQNSLIVDAAIALSKALESANLTQKDLAVRLDKTEGYVSQVLSGGCNLTLKTLAEFAYVMDRMVDFTLKPLDASSAVFTMTAQASWKVEATQEQAVANTQLSLAA